MKESFKTITAVLITVVLCTGLSFAANQSPSALGQDITATLIRLTS